MKPYKSDRYQTIIKTDAGLVGQIKATKSYKNVTNETSLNRNHDLHRLQFDKRMKKCSTC